MSQCERILVKRQDYGEILIDNNILNTYQSLCFVIIAKEEYKIKFLVNDYQQQSNFQWTIYDGNEDDNQIIVSSDGFSRKQLFQTREHHIATIILRKNSVQTDNDIIGYLEMNETKKSLQRRDLNGILLNITWLTSICPDDQMLCGGNFETKCYTKEQRCDGKIK